MAMFGKDRYKTTFSPNKITELPLYAECISGKKLKYIPTNTISMIDYHKIIMCMLGKGIWLDIEYYLIENDLMKYFEEEI